MDKYKKTANDWTYDATRMLTSLPDYLRTQCLVQAYDKTIFLVTSITRQFCGSRTTQYAMFTGFA